MFQKLIDALSAAPALSKGQGADAAIRPELAVAALFVHVARSDGDYADVERQTIDTLLRSAFNLGGAEAAALRAEAEAADAAAGDVVRFTWVLKEQLDEAERELFLERMWRIVLADGARDDHENAFMRKLAGLLYVPDARSNAARLRAGRPETADGQD